jgi:hypothetical protein
MGCVIDHLQSDHRVRVRQDFTDARGARHFAGEEAVLRSMNLDWSRQELLLEWEREGVRETLYFALAAKDGPRSGRMRDYFFLEERVPLPCDDPRERHRREMVARIPSVVGDVVRDMARYGDAVTRVWALAARHCFAEAEEQIRLILAPPDPYDGRLDQLAGDVIGIAIAHAYDHDRTVFAWARERGVGLLYSWGANASAGGEGALRAKRIREAEEFLASFETPRE